MHPWGRRAQRARRLQARGRSGATGSPDDEPHDHDLYRRGIETVLASWKAYTRCAVGRIRDALHDEAIVLEALQRRSSDVWEEHRAELAAHPGAIEAPDRSIAEGRVRVAVDASARLLGFATALPVADGRCELDDLFVAPEAMGLGVGRLLVEDLASRAAATGAHAVDVIANPNALGFYERVGFRVTGEVSTRFGRGVRMSLDLRQEAR